MKHSHLHLKATLRFVGLQRSLPVRLQAGSFVATERFTVVKQKAIGGGGLR